MTSPSVSGTPMPSAASRPAPRQDTIAGRCRIQRGNRRCDPARTNSFTHSRSAPSEPSHSMRVTFVFTSRLTTWPPRPDMALRCAWTACSAWAADMPPRRKTRPSGVRSAPTRSGGQACARATARRLVAVHLGLRCVVIRSHNSSMPGAETARAGAGRLAAHFGIVTEGWRAVNFLRARRPAL